MTRYRTAAQYGVNAMIEEMRQWTSYKTTKGGTMMPKQLRATYTWCEKEERWKTEIDGVEYVPKGEVVWPPEWPKAGRTMEMYDHYCTLFLYESEPWLLSSDREVVLGEPKWEWQGVIDHIHTLAKGHGWVEPDRRQQDTIQNQSKRIKELLAETERLRKSLGDEIERALRETTRADALELAVTEMRPAYPTFWVRKIGRVDGRPYDNTMIWCDELGKTIKQMGHLDSILIDSPIGFQRYLGEHGIHVNVKVWEECIVLPPKITFKELEEQRDKQQPTLTYNDVSRILADARQQVKDGTMTGIDASMLKWDTLIQYAEETGKVHVGWKRACGFCEEHSIASFIRDCSKCPLIDCNTTDWKKMLISGGAMGRQDTWLEAARRFRTWIRETYDIWLAKQQPTDEWVYAIRQAECNRLYECWKDNKYVASSVSWGTVEEALPHLQEDVGWSKYNGSDTPTFGVRKLREGEGDKYGLRKGARSWVAFYNGKFLRGSQYNSETCSPERCIEWVLNKLSPAVPAKTLADLEVSG